MPEAMGPESSPPSASTGQSSSPATPPRATWRRFAFRWLTRLAITSAVLLVLGVALLALAEYETGKPQFCGSCHIMEPYYQSWQADLHGGKLDVACIDCHYAPGERSTINAKLHGLSQVSSYVSGRYGKSRPRAHVDNESCQTSKCHGDLKFMEKEIPLGGTVNFVHAKHLHFDKAKQETMEQRLKELSQSLSDRLGPEHLVKLEEVATECIPARERNDRMAQMTRDWGATVKQELLVEFSQLHDMNVRVAQLADLQCTNCHSYGAPKDGKLPKEESPHFTVKTTTCFTCHFTNQDFNTGTGTCLKCHTILPVKDIIVHPAGTQMNNPKVAKQTIKINHPEMVKRKVNCISCHADVATENSTVTRRDCEHCHDRPEYFTQWQSPLSLDLVKHYHALHVPEQRAKCLDCHSEIHHQLVRGSGDHGQPAFLSAVMGNCLACHPNQHAAQIELLSGTGGVGVAGDPNFMFGARTNCLGCHTKLTQGKHGAVSVTGSVSGCEACHPDPKYARTFNAWKEDLEESLTNAKKDYTEVSQKLKDAKDLDPDIRRQVTELLHGMQADLWLVEDGKGIHNYEYSDKLLKSVSQRSEQVRKLLLKASSPKP